MKQLTSANPQSPLEINVQTIVNEIAAEYTGGIPDFFKTFREKGMSSGMIPYLNDYSESLAFYADHKEEINRLIFSECSSPRLAIRGAGIPFLSDDPLCLRDNNQHGLAWYGFQTIARRLYSRGQI